MNPDLSREFRLKLASAVPPDGPRPRILWLRSFHPPRVAGAWAAELLDLIGGEPFRAAPTGAVPLDAGSARDGDGAAPASLGSPNQDVSVTWEEVLEFDPQLVLLDLGPGEREKGEEAWMRMEGWNRVEAARAGRVLACPPFPSPGGESLEGRLWEWQGLLGTWFWGWRDGKSPDEGGAGPRSGVRA